jgi:hypothetical protein
MATSPCQAAVPAYSALDSTTAIAAVLLKMAGAVSKNRPFVRDISDIFFNLKQRGFRFRDLGLRKIPGGYYSEDVEGFVGQLLSLGYARQRSPIKLTENGRKFCEAIVREENNQLEVAKLREELESISQDGPATV